MENLKNEDYSKEKIPLEKLTPEYHPELFEEVGVASDKIDIKWVEKIGFWSIVWTQFKKNKVAMFGLYCIVLLVSIAIFAPILSLDKAFYCYIDGVWYFPWARALFDRLFFENGVDIFFNLMMVLSPLYILIFLTIKKIAGKHLSLYFVRILMFYIILHGALFAVVVSKAGPFYYSTSAKYYSTIEQKIGKAPCFRVHNIKQEQFLNKGVVSKEFYTLFKKSKWNLPENASVVASLERSKWLVKEKGKAKYSIEKILKKDGTYVSYYNLLEKQSSSSQFKLTLDSEDALDNGKFPVGLQDKLKGKNTLEKATVITVYKKAEWLIKVKDTPQYRVVKVSQRVNTWTIGERGPEKKEMTEYKLDVYRADNGTFSYLYPFRRFSAKGINKTEETPCPPNKIFWFGTDQEGHDVVALMIYGTRISLTIGVVAVSIYITIGIILGATAGFFGGKVDLWISRFIEIMICFPTFFLILTLAAFIEDTSIFHIMVIIGVTRWTTVSRLVRGEFLRLKNIDYVQAAVSLGFNKTRIIFGHVLPNALGPVLVAATFGVASSILTESSLSFLGLGDPTAPSWGLVLSAGRISSKMWLILIPGLAIFFVVSVFNLVGEGLRDALDPKLRQ